MKTKPYKGYIGEYRYGGRFNLDGYCGEIHKGDLDLCFASVSKGDIQKTFEHGIDDYLKYKHDNKCYVKLINWIKKIVMK